MNRVSAKLWSLLLLVSAALIVLAGIPAFAQGPSVTVLTASPTGSSTLGQPVTFTANVTNTAMGMVLFYDLGMPFGAAVLDGRSPSIATFTTSILTADPHSITATYQGSANFQMSVSSALPYTVLPRSAIFTIDSGPTPNPVPVGSASTLVLKAADQPPAGSDTTPPGTFTRITSGIQPTLVTPLSGQTITQLQNGLVLILGGTDKKGTVLNAVTIYDPSSKRFISLGSSTYLQAPRTGPTATLLATGEVLITGGTTTGGIVLKSAEIYNPLSGVFTMIAGSLNEPRSGHTATLLTCSPAPCIPPVLFTGGVSSPGVPR